jgi:hypothetical protein
MANYLMNIGKGRVRELVERVDTNDPADAKIILIPLSASETEANAQDTATVTAFLATAANEQTLGGWVRKTLTDANFTATDYDTNNTDNRGDASLPSVTWTGPTAGNNTTGLLVAYTEEVTPTDAGTIPLSHHDFVVTADGNDVILNAGDFFRAS